MRSLDEDLAMLAGKIEKVYAYEECLECGATQGLHETTCSTVVNEKKAPKRKKEKAEK